MAYVSVMENHGPNNQLSGVPLVLQLLTLPDTVLSTVVQEQFLSDLNTRSSEFRSFKSCLGGC